MLFKNQSLQGAERRAVKYTAHCDTDDFRGTVLKRCERKRFSSATDRSRIPGLRPGDKAVARRFLRWKSKAAKKFYETQICPGGARVPLRRWLVVSEAQCGEISERTGCSKNYFIVALTTVRGRERTEPRRRFGREEARHPVTAELSRPTPFASACRDFFSLMQ